MRSLFGSPAEAAARRANTVKSMACPGEREQEIVTPQEFLDALELLWPGGAILDPCGSLKSLNTAHFRYVLEAGEDGLALPWSDRNFTNPPYGPLQDWLEKATVEWIAGHASVLLIPVRPHRTWWRRMVLRHPVCWLDPLTFVGFDQSFPAPLCAPGFGVSLNEMRRAFSHLGEVRQCR